MRCHPRVSLFLAAVGVRRRRLAERPPCGRSSEKPAANAGVGTLHRPCALGVSLLEAKGQPAVTARAKADPRAWLPGEHAFTEVMLLPSTLAAGADTRSRRHHRRHGRHTQLKLSM